MNPPGIIITVSVLLAAGLAAYENPKVRAWIDRARHKIAMGLHSIGDEINPKPRPQRPNDVSMQEEKGEQADARRRQAIAEIMERGRIMEERRKKKISDEAPQSPPSFGTLVDPNDLLLPDTSMENPPVGANTSAVDRVEQAGIIRHRNGVASDESTPEPLQSSVDAIFPFRQLSPDRPPTEAEPRVPFETRYEQEMRETWNIPLSDRQHVDLLSSHASESLIDLTPNEEVPDPDISIPLAESLRHALNQTEYFSAAALSTSSHTLSDGETESELAEAPFHHTGSVSAQPWSHNEPALSSASSSVRGSSSYRHADDTDHSVDDFTSEEGDGIRTPASAWTEVDSTISGDA